VIIIGGSSGFGRATAAGPAKEGVKIVVAAHCTKEREETVRLISKAESYGDLCR
jgi:NAD(P)-dependent dehydrogenase (short-subunit alcohol dehydrogenase family)